jgi:hypothetical protein
VGKTSGQGAFNIEPFEQRLPDHNAGKRGEFLIIKPQRWKRVKFTVDGCSGRLHINGSLRFCWRFGATNFTEVWAVFFILSWDISDYLSVYLELTKSEFQPP